jgi:hypothetical protein
MEQSKQPSVWKRPRAIGFGILAGIAVLVYWSTHRDETLAPSTPLPTVRVEPPSAATRAPEPALAAAAAAAPKPAPVDKPMTKKSPAAAVPAASAIADRPVHKDMTAGDFRWIRAAVSEYARQHGETEQQFYDRIGSNQSEVAAFVFTSEEFGAPIGEAIQSLDNVSDATQDPDNVRHEH